MMEEMLVKVLDGAPLMAGFVILVYIQNRQNERQWQIIERVLQNCEKIEVQIVELATAVKSLSEAKRSVT